MAMSRMKEEDHVTATHMLGSPARDHLCSDPGNRVATNFIIIDLYCYAQGKSYDQEDYGLEVTQVEC